MSDAVLIRYEPKFYLPPRAIPKKISNLKNTFKNKKIVETEKVFKPIYRYIDISCCHAITNGRLINNHVLKRFLHVPLNHSLPPGTLEVEINISIIFLNR